MASIRRQDEFGLRDLGLNLSTTQGDAASMAFTRDETAQVGVPVPLGIRTKRDDAQIGRRVAEKKKKVTRYFPGQAPKWVEAEAAFPTASVSRRVTKAPAVVLRRREAPAGEAGDAAGDEAAASSSSDSEASSVQVAPRAETAEEVAARRARVREKLSGRRSEEAVEAEAEVESEASESSSESESESSSESSSEEESVRPVFVRKAERGTIKEAEELERAEAARRERENERKAARAEESRALVARVVTREETERHFGDEAGSDLDAPDDVDDLDDPLEFESWRLRELSRVRRDADERDAARREAAETERRRNLTPAQRAAEDAETGKGVKPAKVKWKFLQKYHHKGAFFMDGDALAEDDVRRRDTDGAVGVDKFDRANLPKVLQVKDFGFAGRTKYTHLVDQDTTFLDRDNPFNGWVNRRSSDPLRAKYDAKLAGTKDLDRPFQRRHHHKRSR